MITSYFLVVAVHLLLDNYNYTLIVSSLLAGIRSIGNFFMFVVGGIVAIIVGSFMIRGTMHMWDKPDSDPAKSDEDND